MSVRDHPQPVSADRGLRDSLEDAQQALTHERALRERRERETAALRQALDAAEQEAARVKHAAIGAALGFPATPWEAVWLLLIGAGIGAAVMYFWLR